MKVLKEKDSQRTFFIMAGDSTISVPLDYDSKEIFGIFVLDRLPARVPISHVRFSLESWLQLTEEIYNKLIEIGQPELASKILPRGT